MTLEAYCPGPPIDRSTTNSHVLSWLARKLLAYLIVCAWTCSGAFPDWSARHLLLLWFRVLMPLCLRPLRKLQAWANGIGFCRESNHCDYFIKSSSFCSRNMEDKFTLSFRNVCDLFAELFFYVWKLLYCLLSSVNQLSIGELTQKLHPPRVASPTSRPPFTWKQVNISSHSTTRPPSVFAVEPELLHMLRDEASPRPEDKKEDKKAVQWLGQSGGTEEIFFSLQSTSSPKNKVQTRFLVSAFPVLTPARSLAPRTRWPHCDLSSPEYVEKTIFSPSLSMIL